MRWVAADNPGVDDLRLWTSLTLLGGIDLTHGEGESFLYSNEQITEWRDDLAGSA